MSDVSLRQSPMGIDVDFATKLKNSAGVKSLQQEFELGTCLRDLGWEVVHGAFYSDPIEDKPREIDLQARQVWIKGDCVDFELIATVEILIECKSITGWHLVFPEMFPRTAFSRLEQHERYWIREDKRLRTRLHMWLEEQSFPKGDMEALGAALQLAQYDETLKRTAETVPTVFTAPHIASTFNETNSQNVKDVDNSVLWRATSTVRSAGIAARNRAHDAAFKLLTTGSQDENPVTSTTQDILRRWDRASREVNIVQHVISIGGELWALRGGDVGRIEWTRLFRMQGGQTDWWCDVVTNTAVPEYFRGATAHFASSLQRNGFAQR